MKGQGHFHFMGKQKRPIISKGDMHPHGRRLGQRLLLGRCETHVRNSSWFTSCFHPHGHLLSPHFEDGETEAQRANNVTSLRLGFLICQMGITMVPASLGWCENEMSQCTQSINSVVNNCNSRCDTSVCGYYCTSSQNVTLPRGLTHTSRRALWSSSPWHLSLSGIIRSLTYTLTY